MMDFWIAWLLAMIAAVVLSIGSVMRELNQKIESQREQIAALESSGAD